MTWQKIGNDLPAEPVNVIKEDPNNADVLYVGTDHGLYVSLDSGNSFMGLFNGMPDVPVHDVAIQPRDKEIAIGTHGRSIYIGDVNYIEQLTPGILAEKLHLFPINGITYSDSWGNKYYTWADPVKPSIKIIYFAPENGIADIKIMSGNNNIIKEFSDTTSVGLNFIDYDLTVDSIKANLYKKYINSELKNSADNFKQTDNGKIYLRPGKYTVDIEINGNRKSGTFEIKEKKKKERGVENQEPGNKLPINFDRD
jgi:hypothetical protein